MSAAVAPALVFLPLVTVPGYWVGVANHACADPEYIPGGTYIAETASPDFCPGFDDPGRRMWDDLCPACQAADDKIPF